jgi:hypothetical protein
MMLGTIFGQASMRRKEPRQPIVQTLRNGVREAVEMPQFIYGYAKAKHHYGLS